jgi:apolipoprotein N-acyltransferase
MKRILLVLSSSLLLVLSFPNFDLGFLAWVGLLPLFLSITYRRVIYSFLLSLICGVLFFSGTFYWIFAVPKYSLLNHAPLIVYFGLYFGVFGLIYFFLYTRIGIAPTLFAAPFIWVSLEYIRSNLSFLSLPWALLAHSQYQYPVIIQIASITGAYGISFLIVMVNAALAAVVYQYCERLKIPPRLPFSKGGVTPYQKEIRISPPLEKGDRGGFVYRLPLLATTASLLLLTLLFGYFTITNTIPGSKIKLSLVQGNIEQSKKWDPRYAREIMKTYTELTQEASKEQPAMIIWPETATPGSITRIPMLYTQVKNVAKNAGTYLLLGSAQHQKFAQRESNTPKYFNSVYLINPDSSVVKNQRYDKIRLFPFGEYLPFKEIIPWSSIGVSSMDHYMPGKEFKVFEHPDFRFAVTICWESVFPDLFRQFVKRGGQCMINLTNEARFGKTAASHQVVSITVFRAVENRVFVVRCANTGVSCIIDPYGRVVDRVKNEKGQDIFVRGVMSGWIIPLDSRTIYTRYGDWFVWVAIGGSVVFLAIATLKGRKK